MSKNKCIRMVILRWFRSTSTLVKSSGSKTVAIVGTSFRPK